MSDIHEKLNDIIEQIAEITPLLSVWITTTEEPQPVYHNCYECDRRKEILENNLSVIPLPEAHIEGRSKCEVCSSKNLIEECCKRLPCAYLPND